MDIDRNSPLPRHFQLGEAIKSDIVRNGLSEGDPIPSERVLSETYNISRITVRRAITDLVKDGILRREGRRGTFVGRMPKRNEWQTGSERRLIGVVIPDIEDFFAARIIKGMDDLCHEVDYSITLGRSDENTERAKLHIQRLTAEGIAGLVLVPVACEDYVKTNLGLFEWIRSIGLPFVLIDRYVEGSLTDTVVSDNFDGAYTSTKHLISQGHRRIAYIGYPACSTLNDRIAGFKKCLMDHSIHPDESMIVYPHPRRDRKETIEVTKRLMEKDPKITAIFTANDGVAMDVWTGLQELGLRVPEDVAIAGYDNARGMKEPGALLTTTDPSLYEQGQLACRMLLDRVNGYDGEARFACLKSTFIPGLSTLTGPLGHTIAADASMLDRVSV